MTARRPQGPLPEPPPAMHPHPGALRVPTRVPGPGGVQGGGGQGVHPPRCRISVHRAIFRADAELLWGFGSVTCPACVCALRWGHAEIPGGFRGEAGGCPSPAAGGPQVSAAGPRCSPSGASLRDPGGEKFPSVGLVPWKIKPPAAQEKRLQQPAALARREKAEGRRINRCGAALPANPKRPPLRGLPKHKRRCRPVLNKRGPK